jgi:hypothetical protein
LCFATTRTGEIEEESCRFVRERAHRGYVEARGTW